MYVVVEGFNLLKLLGVNFEGILLENEVNDFLGDYIEVFLDIDSENKDVEMWYGVINLEYSIKYWCSGCGICVID